MCKDLIRNILIIFFFYNVFVITNATKRFSKSSSSRGFSDCNNATTKRQLVSPQTNEYGTRSSIKPVPECSCGKSNDEYSNRIIGGSETVPNAYPWLAALYRVKYNFLYCGGSVITELHIVTAGHCIEGLRPASIFIMLGLHDKNNIQDVLIYSPDEFYLHPKYEEESDPPVNDIAIVRTSKPMDFSSGATPICLPPIKNYDYRESKAVIAGWGAKMYKGTSSDVLLKSKMYVLSDDDCSASKIGHYYIKNLMICGYMINADACQGDSGGPLMTENEQNKYELSGVISFGIGCGGDKMPGIYTNMAYYMDWVQSIIKDTPRCGNTDPIARRAQEDTTKHTSNLDGDKIAILKYLDALKKKIIDETK